ncbi:DUF7706 family protein [Photorhabdus asymbiotica]|uniref:DUF7706 family protein n=1 Tax=Photorhabdus asymbiotica TaxID=291112 RepID=UPI003DA784C3
MTLLVQRFLPDFLPTVESPGQWLSWAEIRACAVNDDEAWLIKDAIGRLQSALAWHGYAPR